MRKKIFTIFITVSVVSVLLAAFAVIFLMSDFMISKEPMLLSQIIKDEGLFYFVSLFIPALIGLLLIAVLLSIFISANVSNNIISSIGNIIVNFQRNLNREEGEDLEVFEEFQPFIKIFEFQNSEIKLQMEQLKEANNRRSEFTANVSHELKTPLVSINGYAEMIESGMAKEGDIKKFAGIIKQQGDVLLGLINEIIELSKLEDYDYSPEFEKISLRNIILKSFERLFFVADRKDIRLSVEGEAEIEGNESLLTELFYNLIENSIKYGRVGGRTEVIIRPSTTNASIIFKDNGQGIPEEDQGRVFERFFRVDKSHSKQIEGTGLGLAIVKHVVEIHKGDIRLKSELGKGTEIEVALPINREQK
ncbi:MAG: histidine kinase [Tissierellia bacterium]|nr:histidine kinase [Tissierellia bacterium]